jgi:hypothetical protein
MEAERLNIGSAISLRTKESNQQTLTGNFGRTKSSGTQWAARRSVCVSDRLSDKTGESSYAPFTLQVSVHFLAERTLPYSHRPTYMGTACRF